MISDNDVYLFIDNGVYLFIDNGVNKYHTVLCAECNKYTVKMYSLCC